MDRSEMMARIRSRNTAPERVARMALVGMGMKGFKTNVRDLPGTPDICFPDQRIALFIDGCFWHGCRIHFRMPKSNIGFWASKINANRSRDQASLRLLRSIGWRVARIWEHELQRGKPTARKAMLRAMSRAT